MNYILIARMRRLTPIDLFTEITCVHRVTSIDLFRDVAKVVQSSREIFPN